MDMTIPDVLQKTASRLEKRIGFQSKSGREWKNLTYGELQQQARAFASGLIALGLRPQDRVGIVAENSLEWIIAYLGLSMAGAIGVPIYYDLKPPEIEEGLRRADCRFVVTSSKSLDKIPDRLPDLESIFVITEDSEELGQRSSFTDFIRRRPRARVMPFAAVAAQASAESDAALAAVNVKPDDLASIVYTSGTTGGAKGVMLTHRNFTADIAAIPKAFPVGDKDKVLLVLPLHHVYAFTIEFLLTLSMGTAVVIENDLVRLRDRMAETHPSVFCGVPALYEIMWRAIRAQAEAQGRGKTFERALSISARAKERTGVNIGRLLFRQVHARLGGNIRFLASGGAALNPEVARGFQLLGFPILQGWGLTETAPLVTGQRFSPLKFRFTKYYERQLGSVGKALPGIDVDLVDVPEKEIYVKLHDEGELIVRGDNVMPGYWKAEAETRAVKIGDWFRTGDVGRIDREGNVYITGRSKYIIVLESGEKIHPDEVEGKLQASPLIEDIAIVGRKTRGKTQVACIIYPNVSEVIRKLEAASQPVDESTLRATIQSEIDQLEEGLAPYKRPQEMLITDTPLPKIGALRKVHREQLQESYPFDVKRWQESAAIGPIP